MNAFIIILYCLSSLLVSGYFFYKYFPIRFSISKTIINRRPYAIGATLMSVGHRFSRYQRGKELFWLKFRDQIKLDKKDLADLKAQHRKEQFLNVIQ